MRIIDGLEYMQLLIGVGARAAPPVVVSLSPAFGSTAGDTVPHTLTGTGFTGATSVTIGGAAATFSVTSDTEISITATPARTAGQHDVVVTRGGQTGTLASGYRAVAIAAWYRADLGRTMNGSTVSTWADQSGNGDANRNATQGTAGAQPTYTASSANFNNQPVLSFDGGDWLATGTWSASSAEPRTIYFVGRPGVVAQEVAYDGISASRAVLYNFSNNATLFVTGNLSSGKTWNSTTRVVCGVFNAASSAIYVDRHTTADASGNPGTSSLTGLTIGRTYTGTLAWTGSQAELIVCSGAHDATTREAIVTYLGTRYGVTVTA